MSGKPRKLKLGNLGPSTAYCEVDVSESGQRFAIVFGCSLSGAELAKLAAWALRAKTWMEGK